MKYQSTARNAKRQPRAQRSRAYDSPLRVEQAAQTRERIIQAYGDEICTGDGNDVTVQQIAARAGVSLPTVYRHFENLEALGEAFWGTIEHRLPSLDAIKTPDDLPLYTERLFSQFEREPVLNAMLWTGPGRRLRRQTVARRNLAFQRALAPLTKHMPEREAREVTAMCKVISSGHVWDLLHGDWGLTGAEAAQVAGWALRVLVDALRKNPNPLGQRQLKGQ